MRVAYIPIILLFVTCTVCAAGERVDQSLRSYTYASPAVASILKKARLTEADLIQFADKGLKARSIFAIDPNRVYDGSDDALRIDIRKSGNGIALELSVRQGASVHNMLQRWRRAALVRLPPNLSATESRQKLLASLSLLLDNLKTKFNSPGYQQGEMLEE